MATFKMHAPDPPIVTVSLSKRLPDKLLTQLPQGLRNLRISRVRQSGNWCTLVKNVGRWS
jgi:hypothetical protein